MDPCSGSKLITWFGRTEKASGVNVAGEIIDYVMSETAFSEIDLDQLLRTVPGSGVLSLQLRNHPMIVGDKIVDLFSRVTKLPCLPYPEKIN